MRRKKVAAKGVKALVKAILTKLEAKARKAPARKKLTRRKKATKRRAKRRTRR